jgi:P27 family predicted phage terminase small subunit
MSPCGRKPKPTHLKLVTGTARRCRLPKNEPRPELALPPVPSELSDDAKLEWNRVMPDLFRAGLMTRLDRAVLAAYCSAHGRWVRAERALRKLGDEGADGLLIKTAKGNVIQNPLVGVSNKAANDMAKFAAELGMSPSSRARFSVAPAPSDNDPAMKYFTGDRD